MFSLILALLAGFDDSPVWQAPNAQMKSVVMSAIGRKLLDADSAKFVWPKENANGVVYCGWVNSRNSVGGYVGYRPFMIIGSHMAGPKGRTDYRASSAYVYDPTDHVESAGIGSGCAKGGFDLSRVPSTNPNDHS